MTEDFVAAAEWLHKHDGCNGKIGVVGFCFGGGMANTLAVRLPEIVRAAVPFYGGQPDPAEASKIRGALLLQFAEQDPRVKAGWPAYEQALKEAEPGDYGPDAGPSAGKSVGRIGDGCGPGR